MRVLVWAGLAVLSVSAPAAGTEVYAGAGQSVRTGVCTARTGCVGVADRSFVPGGTDVFATVSADCTGARPVECSARAAATVDPGCGVVPPPLCVAPVAVDSGSLPRDGR